MIATIKSFLKKKPGMSLPRPAAEAYDLWADSYDVQPGNLMLDLDEVMFTELLKDVDLAGKTVADIGCGTGRHWKKIIASSPALVKGYDVSDGMLQQLKLKFPGASTNLITDNLLSDTETASIDCIISTLTIAHIENLEETIAAWARVLKNGGDIILTDFHPETLSEGGRRTFRHDNELITVTNFVHSIEQIKTLCKKYGLIVQRQEEKYIDDTVRSYYEAQNAMHVFNQFKGMAIIYGLHIKKLYVAD